MPIIAPDVLNISTLMLDCLLIIQL